MTDRSPVIQLESGNKTRALTFTADGEYLVSGDEQKVRIWRVEDGKQITSMVAGLVNCLSVSKDGRLTAAGTLSGKVFVWDAQKSFRNIWTLEDHYVIGLDFSPINSSHLLTASFKCTATVWDIENREHVLTLPQDDEIVAAKYSQRGDRLAVATCKLIRVYDSGSGRLLSEIRAEVTPWYNTGLLWSNDQLLIVSESKIKQVDAASGSLVSEWSVPDSDASSCIALQQHGEFVAYSANRTVTIWDTSETHTQLDLIHHTQIIRSVVISPGDRFLAIGGERGKIIIKRLPRNLTDSIPLSRLHPTFREPDIQIDDPVLDLWKQGQFANAEEMLTEAIPTSRHSNHVLASRALVRTGLREWDTAIADAKESIKTRPSVIGYIAKGVAHVGKGEKHKAYRTCDVAFERYHSTHVTFLLLIKAIIVFMAGEHSDAISRLDDLIATVRFNSICYVVQAKMYLLLGQLHMEQSNYEDAVYSFERARAKMRRHTSRPLAAVSLITGWKFDDLASTIPQCLCEAQFAVGHAVDAAESFLKLLGATDKEGDISKPSVEWISEFTQRCLCTLESDGDIVADIDYMRLLREWATAELTRNSWKDALAVSVDFSIPRFIVYRAICEHLEVKDRIADATHCFHQMMSEPPVEASMCDEQARWTADFKLRSTETLKRLGDTAMKAEEYDDAISWYSTTLSLEPEAPQDLFIKRSKAYVAQGSWQDGLKDAEKVITLDPSSPWGYERKHAALHRAGSYDLAIEAFKTMRSVMSRSDNPDISNQFVDPEQTISEIRAAIQRVVCHSPRVLIDTETGSLVEKNKQGAYFESLPVFKQLVSSMTTHTDHTRIKQEVTEYYRYATFSHTWEDNEPLYDHVVRVMVYDLEQCPTHDKLQMFCKIVREAGFNWAWSDTCCINKTDHVVLQEALVAMFKWYEGSSLTVIFLRGVRSPSRRGDLIRSIWNTRAWTFQEYHASKVVRFYTEDWQPYLDLDILNHKESTEIISEMEEATGISSQALMELRPGRDDIREKLCLAARRHTTLVEDAAYSLLGIFSIYLPVVYGEGDHAIGRLLRELLASSGDTSILAWTGRSGSFNSCLPASINVFERFPPSNIPPATEDAATETNPARTRMIIRLYDRLQELPVPSLAEKRMKLPCLVFKLGRVTAAKSSSGWVLHARTDALGVVEITTTEDLTQLSSLTLVHPWIDFLLDRRPIRSFTKEETTRHRSSTGGYSSSNASSTTPTSQRRRTSLISIFRLRNSRESSLPSPVPELPADKRTRALRFVARLRQPFGALLLTPTKHNMEEYRRVAAESVITVQIRQETSPETLIDCVRVLDVL